MSSAQRTLAICFRSKSTRALLLSWLLLSTSSLAVAQQRVLGVDVSAWQGNILQDFNPASPSSANWETMYGSGSRRFAFIRSSRGGTTGYYNQSDPNNLNGQNTLSQRY